MDYSLAKELKEAGFPQVPIFSKDEPHGNYMEGNVEVDDGGLVTTNSIYAPSLEELIEACGEGHLELIRMLKLQAWTASLMGKIAKGSTPTEAVARLWLALNKKP